MQFHSAASANRADPALIEMPEQAHSSVIGLEAALGACREKALELELRLRSAEDRIQMQVSISQASFPAWTAIRPAHISAYYVYKCKRCM